MNRKKQIFLHIAVWISILFFFLYLGGKGKINYQAVVIVLYFGIINIAVFYVNYLLILPRFLNQKKYWWCALSMLLLVVISGFVKYGLASVFRDMILVRGIKKYHLGFGEYYMGAVMVSCFFLFLSTAFKFMTDWFVNEKVKSKLENEKLAAELAFLKSQINPHFLFNSLNNIYSLAYQQSAKTPEAILKLSEIMRYMLYESNDDKVELSKEIRYLENYIELQKLRFKDRACVQLHVQGEPDGQSIMPLVLISFVENAFKHGVATDPEHPIRICMDIRPQQLLFKVQNKISNQNKDFTGGIGLLNVKRRLDLLYKNRYELSIENNQGIYTSRLQMEI